MDTRTLTPFMLANVTLVIDRNGQFREQAAGTPLRPGEVVVQVSDDASPQVTAELVNPGNAAPTNLDGEIAQILQQIQQGADPTQNPELATAAGGQNGSSPTATGSIDRTGDEVLAATNFETQGLQGLGLSSTQSLALTDLLAQVTPPISVNPTVVENPEPEDTSVFRQADETDAPIVLSIDVQQTDSGVTPTFIEQTYTPVDVTLTGEFDLPAGFDSNDDYGSLTYANGEWQFEAGDAFNSMNVGDAITIAFEVQAEDGSTHNVNVQINGVNDNPEFTESDYTTEGNPNYENGNDFSNDSGYVFYYDENSPEFSVVGKVAATDIDSDTSDFTYEITSNVQVTVDGQTSDAFGINEYGEIYLTEAGAAALTNDYETLSNIHDITVKVTDAEGGSASIGVELHEMDVYSNTSILKIYDETDEPISVSIAVVPAESNVLPTFVDQTVYQPTNVQVNGTFTLPNGFDSNDDYGSLTYSGGEWQFLAGDAFNAMNVGDSITMTFEAQAQDGTTHTIEVRILGVNDNPVFTESEYTEEDGSSYVPGNDFNDQTGYVFHYDENSLANATLGQVVATDIDSDDSELTYEIVSNVQVTVDGVTSDAFGITADGEIYLTAAGAAAYTNDYEDTLGLDEHMLQVKVTDAEGGSSVVDVKMVEDDVTTAPTAEDFTVTIGSASEVLIPFEDSSDPYGYQTGHIWDAENDDPDQLLMNIVLTSLPENGTLLYTENGVTRELTTDDLYTGQSDPTLLNPYNITYVPEGNEVVIGSTDDGSLVAVDDDYQFVLDNGNTIYISAFKTLGNGNEVSQQVTLIDTVQQGTGLSVATGNGINSQETLHVDLSENPLYTISFGVDGLNTNHAATVTYYFENSDPVTISYQGNGDYSYTASSDDPVIGLDFTASNNDGSSGANYVVTHLSGTETVVDDSTFTYQAVDSDGEFSNVATVTLDADDSTPSYHVFSAEAGDPVVNATVGNDVLIGDSQANVFTWLDSALDNSTDVVKNFEFNTDKLDLSAVLDSGEDFNTLLSKIDVVVGAEDVTLQVSHDSGETQSIVIDNGVDIFGLTSSSGLMTDDVAQTLLSQIVKTETV
ncbi:VCBS domain-containing protein [Vibrio fluvialis]|uniref:VCBS domain-containing protein n=1 Tax=Vibrio fluvialis TaxID=676 RepID=UPI001C9BD66C|nr:VCBS domain-containing protein [Vibrio fluvialis]EKO3384500.1 VCBS domain-containing protein [Vibrio fluvialis]MBY7934084.1 VCBS domain-containing protein [Vibrio fluvialis]MCE7582726.1 VCBS domain-containing protein [Vibrio fluvialis]